MNNKIFIAAHVRNEAMLDTMRERVEGYHFFDRYGNDKLSEKYGSFGFKSVAAERDGGKVKCIMKMLGCSYVYFPFGWQDDKCSRKAFAWAEFLNKKIIFEEDGRCR